MLNKYRYKNKKRYNFKEKKEIMLLSSNNYIINEKYKNWRGNLLWKNKDLNNIVYRSIFNYYKQLKYKKIIKDENRDWAWQTGGVWKKRPFNVFISDRKDFFDKVILCIQNKDNLCYIRNSLFYLYESNVGFHRVLDVLNFYWLYDYKDTINKYDTIEKITNMSIKSFFLGFLKNGFKRQCEKRFILLLLQLKKKNKKRWFTYNELF